jgi:hypothetical protein
VRDALPFRPSVSVWSAPPKPSFGLISDHISFCSTVAIRDAHPHFGICLIDARTEFYRNARPILTELYWDVSRFEMCNLVNIYLWSDISEGIYE